jgi:hypothetical protein
VSLLSDKGVPIEQIARLIGHASGSAVTETVYRKQLRPVIEEGAVAMNELFPRADRYSVRYSPQATRSKKPGPELRQGLLTRLFAGGRYWDRTSDLFGVNEALSP